MAAGAVMHAACEDVKGAKASSQKPEDLAEVLAKVDDVTITVGEFQERINQQSPYVRARYTSIERKKEFLDNLVRFEVLAKEARAARARQGSRSRPHHEAGDDPEAAQGRVRQAEAGRHHRRRLQEVLRRAPRRVQQARGSARVARSWSRTRRRPRRCWPIARIKGVDNQGSATWSPSTRRIWRPRIAAATCATSTPRPRTCRRRSSTRRSSCRTSATSRQPVKTAQGVVILKLTGRRKALSRTLRRGQAADPQQALSRQAAGVDGVVRQEPARQGQHQGRRGQAGQGADRGHAAGAFPGRACRRRARGSSIRARRARRRPTPALPGNPAGRAGHHAAAAGSPEGARVRHRQP